MLHAQYPKWFERRLVSNQQALDACVTSGTRIASGFATSEPYTFYSTLWDHIQTEDLTDISIRQGLFMAPHRLCVGDALQAEGLLDGLVQNGFSSSSIFGNLARLANAATKKVDGLNRIIEHFQELRERRVVFVSAFLGQASNMMIPSNAITNVMAPDFVGRNPSRMGIVDMQSVHFPDAVDSVMREPDGRMKVNLVVLVMTPPDENGLMSHGVANGATADALDAALADPTTKILLYVNDRYPFTYGYGDASNVVPIDTFQDAAKENRLYVVEDEAAIPALPAGAFDHPAETEVAIAKLVVGHIEENLAFTAGRALQVGIGGTGVLAIKGLIESGWRGRVYTEMLEPFTLKLYEAGKIDGSHFIERNGTRTDLPGKIVCTFTLGEAGTDFYEKLHRNPDLVLAPASRVVIPEGFYRGMGINNILGIDFQGHVNSGGRGHNHYSGIGGAAAINRGLGRGGVAYLCMKSTHTGLDGKRHSSVFPFLPEGTPVSLTGPDLMGTREGARFFLATEQGVVRINGLSQSEFIRAIISVAHPDFRDELEQRAYEEFRVRFRTPMDE